MATHSSILAWRIQWAEEPVWLLSMGLHRGGHDWSDLACMHALEKEMAAHSSVLAWRIPGTVEPGGLLSMESTQSRTRLKRLSSSSSSSNVPVCPLFLLQAYCCSVPKSCMTLWDPMDCSTPGFPVPYYLLEFAQTRVLWFSGQILGLCQLEEPPQGIG